MKSSGHIILFGSLVVKNLYSPGEVASLKTEFGAKTMGLDTKTHSLFVDTADFTPPSTPTADHPRPQRSAIPGTFRVLVYGKQ